MSDPGLPSSSQSLYDALLTRATAGGLLMLSRVLSAARQSLAGGAQSACDVIERDHLALCLKLLESHTPQLCGRFPKALENAFRGRDVPESRMGAFASPSLRLDQLELMDDVQVKQRVEVARALQTVLLVAQPALTRFESHVSALRGRKLPVTAQNLMRPEAYLLALQSVMFDMHVPVQVQLTWFQHLSAALGRALVVAYEESVAFMQGHGVAPVALPDERQPDGSLVTRALAGFGNKGQQPKSHAALTLERLRRLMAGDLETAPTDPRAAFDREFSRKFEANKEYQSVSASFEPTVPAALEALEEMAQLDHLIARMTQRQDAAGATADAASDAVSLREQLKAKAPGMAQSLSLEVVALMVDNLVQDTRLLAAVRDIIARLEPALLRLVMVDARFFVDREHPARRLLQEISQRGLAFGSFEDSHFNAFLVSLQRFVSPLSSLEIDSAEPFEVALGGLMRVWRETDGSAENSQKVDSAVAALKFAEERNLLAEKIVMKMQVLAELRQVPVGVVDFLCGPWAQVMAFAQLKDQTGADDPGGYKALVGKLLWSAQPELTRENIDRLAKLVPRLLSGLREGLRLIDYPSTKTSVFFDLLMKLHQQAFQPAASVPLPSGRAGLVASLMNDDHWVAPAEAKASGFLALSDEIPAGRAPAAEEKPVWDHAVSAGVNGEMGALLVGSWVELEVKGAWTRTQLSWVSPQRTMYLFTSVQGKTQSMSQRMLERLISTGELRVLSAQPVVDRALDAVVKTAMLNSLDLKTG